MPNVSEDSSFGFGVRVIVNGAWGFASSPIVTPEEIARITGEAAIIAKANAAIQPRPIILRPSRRIAIAGRPRMRKIRSPSPWRKSSTCCAGTESKEEREGLPAAGLSLRSEDKYFASSEGSSIQQLILQIYGNVDATAVDRKNISRTRNYMPTQASAGWEYVPEMNLEENAQRIREEVLEHLAAPAVKPGQEGSGPDAEPPHAHHSRERRAPDRARPVARLRSQLRGHQLHHAG